MGKDLADHSPIATALFDKANAIVGYDLRQFCFDGPEDKLNATTVSQPAIFAVSAAMLAVVKDKNPNLLPDVTAGLSMGEYTALYAAGLMTFEDTLRLVQKRGDAMQAAADASNGSMVSLLGLDEDKVRALCDEAAEGGVLEPVNFNCPGQIVISGSVDACKRAEQLAENTARKKAIPLAVAGAFHSSLMDPALANWSRRWPIAPSETDLTEGHRQHHRRLLTDAAAIRQGLVKQLVQPILWHKCMERLLAEGVETFYEIGPGRVLTGLMKRIHRRANVVNLSSWDSLQTL